MTALPPPTVMDRAVSRRDADFDGVFVVAVRTTGIFCRPSCPARPLPQNRVYYPSAGDALRAGYRPCSGAGRCWPAGPSRRGSAGSSTTSKRRRASACRTRSCGPSVPTRWPPGGTSCHHFGMTFQAYCRGRRLGEAFRQLKRGAPLDTIALENGYESLSGFRDAFGKAFGRPPRQANGSCVLVSWVESPVSPLLLGATDAGLCAVEFVGRTDLNGQLTELQDSLRTPVVPGTNRYIQQATRELAEYFAGQRKDFTVPLDVKGTPFQRAVWGQLTRIPYGQTCSYEDFARAVNKSPTACRAVGQANGRNRIVILIPCHRVVNKDGSLGGYGGGLSRKRFLLELERKHQ